MDTKSRYTILAVVALAIIGSIVYLESKKPHYDASAEPDIVVATSTISTSSSVATTASATQTSNIPSRTSIIAQKAAEFPKAKELVDPTGFINTAPFKLSDYAGKKVILVDFWTYSCINCQRTLPYLKAWYQKYKDQGLVIVGVHTPEFDFEKDINNVSQAVKEDDLTYPVVLDNNQGTWNAYGNQYWPHEYLIDIDGFIVDDHIGEGGYADTEASIQKALKERAQVLNTGQTISTGTVSPQDAVSMDSSEVNSPETYFGFERNEYLGNGSIGKSGSQTLTIPSPLDANKLYLGGTWNFEDQYAESTSQTSEIKYQYDAKNVYLVGSSANGVKIKILKDGQPLGSEAGTDVTSDGTVLIKENKLYNLIQGSSYGTHTIDIQVLSPGLNAYTFTFG